MTPEERRLREELIKYAIDLNRSGLSTGKSGNISVGYQREMLITPSGLEYQQLAAEDIVKLDFSGQKKCSSPYPPSSEWHFHADIYQTTPSIHAIVHTHSTYCTALACTSRNIPPFHYMVAVAGGNEIPLAPYAPFGTKQLSNNIIKHIKGFRACLLENHGMLTMGSSLKEAFQLAEEVEQLAQQYCTALTIGHIKMLTEEEMVIVLKKFESYGR